MFVPAHCFLGSNCRILLVEHIDVLHLFTELKAFSLRMKKRSFIRMHMVSTF